MRIIDRFDEYMTFKHLNDNRATKDLGFSIGMIGKSRSEGRDLSKKAVQRILAIYNDIDETWFKTGEGEMICEPRNTRQGLFGKESAQTEEEDAPSAFSASPSSLDKLIDQMFTNGKTMAELAKQIGFAHQLIANEQQHLSNAQQHLSKAQEETDRILSLLELEKGSKNELEKALRKHLDELTSK
jgi:hypothetical protein